MSNPSCVYAPGPWGNCLDLTCAAQGGHCKYVGPPGRNACRCVAAMPSPSRAGKERQMTVSTAVESYRQAINHIPQATTPLPDTLARARAGDEASIRELAGSFLHTSLELAAREFSEVPEAHHLDLIQEANAGIVAAIQAFQGKDPTDFEAHVKAAITGRLQAFLAEYRRDEKNAS